MNNADKLRETLLRAARGAGGPLPRAEGFEQRVLARLDAAGAEESPWVALGQAARWLAPAMAAVVAVLGVVYVQSPPDDLLAMNDALVNSAVFGVLQ